MAFRRRPATQPWLHRLRAVPNGVAQALTHVAGDGGKHPPIPNVRIHHGDALEVLARVPDGTLSFVYLLHPILAQGAPCQAQDDE